MAKRRLVVCLLVIQSFLGYAQQSKDIVFAITCPPTADSTRRQLSWRADLGATSYRIVRRTSRWEDVRIINLPTDAATRTGYTDSMLLPGVAYQYVVTRNTTSIPLAGGVQQGYLMAGHRLPAPGSRGELALVIEKTIADSLPAQVRELVADYRADGYRVHRLVVRAADSVATVRRWIQARHQERSLALISLVGHVPVPYSGFITPDGHQEHKGAWPADGIYGDMSSQAYTDQYVNQTQAARSQNKNIPGDAKYDASYLQALRPAEMVGVARVDFYNLPAFAPRGLMEVGLMRRYLAKLHRYKTGVYKAQPKAFIDDNFGYRGGEAFASGGWANSYALLGENALRAAEFEPWVDSVNYLIGYGCGGGSYTSASGVAATTDFVRDSLNVVFTMLFGSYHGDWDTQDNFLRAILAGRGSTLACSWDGRPHHLYHPLGIGGTLADCARLTMLNNDEVRSGYGPRMVHIGFLGDAALRAVYPTPPRLARARAVSGGVRVSWRPSPEAGLAGYFLYRGPSDSSEMTRVNTRLLSPTDTVFVDGGALNGTFVYQVKAVKLETTPGGSYYNESLAALTAPASIVTAGRQAGQGLVALFPNPASKIITLQAGAGISVQTITVRDAAGRVCLRQGGGLPGRAVRLDVSGLAAGVYTLTAETSAGRVVRELVRE